MFIYVHLQFQPGEWRFGSTTCTRAQPSGRPLRTLSKPLPIAAPKVEATAVPKEFDPNFNIFVVKCELWPLL